MYFLLFEMELGLFSFLFKHKLASKKIVIFIKMKCNPLRFIPPFFVILLGGSISLTVILRVYPKISSVTNHKFLALVGWSLEIFFFVMFIWSWIYTSFADSGSLEKDLKRRGVLDRILQGDMPVSLQNLPICPKCRLPMPPRCKHCTDCDKCILRMDHHCAVTGQCIGDKNFKAFILTFFYGGFLGVIDICTAIFSFAVGVKDVLTTLVVIYGGLFGMVLFFFVFIFASQSFEYLYPTSAIRSRPFVKLPFREGMEKLLSSFGSNLFQKLIPIQKTTTEFAWFGVDWEEETPLL